MSDGKEQEMRKQKNFLKRVRLLQGFSLVLVIMVILSLVRISALLPGVSEEADERKVQAKQKVYQKEYIRGSILDRKGEALAWSKEPGGDRHHSQEYASSSLIGYYSIIYGTSGLEARFNDLLTHSASPEGNKRGADVFLTLDRNLQNLAFEQIKDMTGSVVILDAKTGEILALASSPSYNADKLEEEWAKNNEKEGVFLSNAYQNPVTPGSVFKLVTSKAILEQGLEKKKVEDKGALKVNGQTIHNFEGTAYGTLKWEEGFIKSSNVYFMTMALKMGGQTLYDAAKDFLLGEEIALDFTTLRSGFDMDTADDNQIAATSFGQGNTLVTPLTMAMITQAIANDGKMMKPYLIKEVVDGKGKTMEKGKAELLKKTMKPKIAEKIRKAMTKAGESYELDQIGEKNYKIAAKTGTAQRGDGKNNAWLVTFAPADDPQYVIVVNRLCTKKIGKTLAPVAESLYEELFMGEEE